MVKIESININNSSLAILERQSDWSNKFSNNVEKVVARAIFKTNGWVIGGGVSAICRQQYVDLNEWDDDHIKV